VNALENFLAESAHGSSAARQSILRPVVAPKPQLIGFLACDERDHGSRPSDRDVGQFPLENLV
jgi:hypothetical protein